LCGEIDKTSNLQKQIVDNEIFYEKKKEDSKRTNQSEQLQQKIAEVIEEGKSMKLISKQKLNFVSFFR